MSVSRITVAICTWNRCELLRQTLDEMTRVSAPAGVMWELLVVNNNCTDDTDAVLAAFANRLPLRRLFEGTPGLSNARNTAVREATGEYIIWTDDDVLVAPDWLVAYCDAFTRFPDAGSFGGPIAAWFPNEPPAWLRTSWSSVSAAYAAIDHGPDLLVLDHRRLPFGANMAMRIDVPREFPFDPARGVSPGRRLGGEEIDVIRRAMDSGRPTYWIPGARVRHYIPVDRQTLAYLKRYYEADGEHMGRYERPASDAGSPTLFGRPRWLWRHAVVTALRYRIARLSSAADVWMIAFMEASRTRGKLKGYVK